MSETTQRDDARFWKLIALIALAVLAVLLIWVASEHLLKPADESITTLPEPVAPVAYVPVQFSELPGWEKGLQQQALGAFKLSCEQLASRSVSAPVNTKEATGLETDFPVAGFVADWLPACEDMQTAYGSAEEARRFFETHFRPFQIFQPDDKMPDLSPQGLFTGYFEPVYKASDVKTEEMSVPILSRPEDLVMVDLGVFRDELAGTRIAGRVIEGQLVPYASHKEIIIDGIEANVLGWMNPNDLLFLQIQGSGKLDFGTVIKRFGYAAQNGHPYTAIGG
ncbi:MAG: MltA domain-containing protein, partial [Aquisalinus sp.]|nr:MltA domain-containing protein [Aquisalinus sp.]